MLAPRRVREEEENMSKELKELKKEEKRVSDILFDFDHHSTEEANAAVDAFNEKWLAAGGLKATTLVHRERLGRRLS